ELRRVERLHRVDDADRRPLALERGAHGLELRLGKDLDGLCTAEARGPKLHLRRRLLAGHEQRAPAAARDRGERRQEERRLPDAGLAADEDERRGNDAAAEDAVELRHAGRDALGLLDLDVDEPQDRPRLAGTAGPGRGGRLLDERPKGAAARTAAEPPGGGIAALGAGVLDRDLGHATESR